VNLPPEFAQELVEEARARMRASREAREDVYFAAVRAASSALALGGSLDAFDRAVEDAEVAFCRGVVEDLTQPERRAHGVDVRGIEVGQRGRIQGLERCRDLVVFEIRDARLHFSGHKQTKEHIANRKACRRRVP
jgi:hypothetical protein